MSKRPAGKPCYDCEDMVPMAQVRVIEAEAVARSDARPVIRCGVCEGTVTVPTSRPGDAELVRREMAR